MARRIVLCLCAGLLLAAPAAGDDIYGRKQNVDARIAALRDRIEHVQSQEHALTAAIADVTTKIRTLEQRVGDVSAQLATVEHDLALHERRLAKLTQLFRLETRRLQFLRREYAAALERLNRRLVGVYEEGDPDTIDVLVSATSFADLLEQFDYVNEIEVQDHRIAEEVRNAKLEVQRSRDRTARVRTVVGAETRAIEVRRNQVRRVREALLASQHALTSSRAQSRENLAIAKAHEQSAASEAAALSAVSAQLAARIQEAQATQSYAPAVHTGVSSSGLIWPVQGPVTSPFGMRWGRLHTGIDIGAPYGAPIHAAAAGVVIDAGWLGGYGNLVVIDHGRGLATAYAHQSQIAVANGQQVSQGQTIGYVGCTGHCFGPHLHFEVRVNGVPVDPLGYL